MTRRISDTVDRFMDKAFAAAAAHIAENLRAKAKLLLDANDLEVVCVKTIEDGFMTKDLALCVYGDAKTMGDRFLSTNKFFDKVNENLRKSIRNCRDHQFLPPEGVNVFDLLRHDTLIVSKDAAKALEARCLRTKETDQ